ncbi:Urease operon accessory protein [Rhizobium sp. KVB221]|uniref:Urease operon accessory protein n=1 Tax=Rhizobium setariae TaxID=2801340 RepID=A0A936YPI4_9HYPH|nr:glycosyltransferase family 29 protein [Rhizobium setariae]MBL0372467.1 Urease operon accessory protein [Rhizobium setariae]
MGRSVVIVGNGAIDPGLGNVIDAADIVMRFNDCRSVGAGGSKTDIVVVCNTGRPGKAMLEGPGWKQNPAVSSASSIWCVRDPARFAAMRAPLAISHPELDDFCDDYTEGFADFANQTGKALHVIPATTHDRLDRELAAYAPTPYVVPSTGLVALAEVLGVFRLPTDRVSIVGFGHQGWEWHPWEAERQWVEARIAERKLNRILQDRLMRPASGA